MKFLITGSNGFIGRNLKIHLLERKGVEVRCFTRDDHADSLNELVRGVDFIFHLAGVNRPVNGAEFISSNVDLTLILCRAILASVKETGKIPVLIYTSSIQADMDNEYGVSKRLAEQAILELGEQSDVPVFLYRLPNVFGKWAKPNYNSAVATFCYNISRGLPIRVDNPSTVVSLVYVEDLIQVFLKIIDKSDVIKRTNKFSIVKPIYRAKVGEIAQWIQNFRDSRLNLLVKNVGGGLMRALYSTYISYLPSKSFSYSLPRYLDSRGVFVEMLKTQDCGQFSYFTAGPGVTRGGHYHHVKTEKFLVLKGRALFKFVNLLTDENCEMVVMGEESRVVETIPGWAHDITNIGNDELIVMLWANELFDRAYPDTFPFLCNSLP